MGNGPETYGYTGSIPLTITSDPGHINIGQVSVLYAFWGYIDGVPDTWPPWNNPQTITESGSGTVTGIGELWVYPTVEDAKNLTNGVKVVDIPTMTGQATLRLEYDEWGYYEGFFSDWPAYVGQETPFEVPPTSGSGSGSFTITGRALTGEGQAVDANINCALYQIEDISNSATGTLEWAAPYHEDVSVWVYAYEPSARRIISDETYFKAATKTWRLTEFDIHTGTDPIEVLSMNIFNMAAEGEDFKPVYLCMYQRPERGGNLPAASIKIGLICAYQPDMSEDPKITVTEIQCDGGNETDGYQFPLEPFTTNKGLKGLAFSSYPGTSLSFLCGKHVVTQKGVTRDPREK